uniref:Uncharacterized protein n=1 Tax=Peronospora matthiolae TaxID=2874970 RepID=A0AAV1THZ0_9STRA
MVSALAQQVTQNSQLREDVNELLTPASDFAEFVQYKYDRTQVRYEEEVKRSDAFREALAYRVDQTVVIAHLKAEILHNVWARHAAQEKADREVAGIRKQMNDAGFGGS